MVAGHNGQGTRSGGLVGVGIPYSAALDNGQPEYWLGVDPVPGGIPLVDPSSKGHTVQYSVAFPDTLLLFNIDTCRFQYF